jgi:hypothetical protein
VIDEQGSIVSFGTGSPASEQHRRFVVSVHPKGRLEMWPSGKEDPLWPAAFLESLWVYNNASRRSGLEELPAEAVVAPLLPDVVQRVQAVTLQGEPITILIDPTVMTAATEEQLAGQLNEVTRQLRKLPSYPLVTLSLCRRINLFLPVV